MNRLLSIIVIAMLLIAGWNRPLKPQIEQCLAKVGLQWPGATVTPAEAARPQPVEAEPVILPTSVPKPAAVSAPHTPAAKPVSATATPVQKDRNWMFKKGTLDAPDASKK